KVTRAMEMVSAAKLRRAQSVLMAGRPYAANLQQLLSYLAGSATVGAHPLFEQREEKKVTLVIFTAERGLCGSFNANIIKMAEAMLKKNPEKQWELFCIGKKGREYFKKRQWPIVESIVGLSGKPEVDVAKKISDKLLERFTSRQTDAVYLLYSAFVTMAVYRPTAAKFLSLDAAELSKAGGKAAGPKAQALDYILEPSPERVFDALLPRYLTSKIYITMAEVMTSEHSARMLAMNNATKNCNELADTLTLRMNKARQAQITRELIDIVGGAQAVS
ncbi:ATP synthase F1 subunit gamma, partial [Candidatus Sumerlaeota bacterium]|nr:ATP synthase F1 subunit gamma [Candidatus Sumerlaeota bacterium]